MGGSILPTLTDRGEAQLYDFSQNHVPGETARDQGYWRDVGTLDAYYDAHMDLIAERPAFNLYNRSWPIYTHSGQLSPARFNAGGIASESIISAGCLIRGQVTRSVLSPGVGVDPGAVVQGSVLHDNVRIGRGAVVRGAVLDKNVEVPAGRDDRRQPGAGRRALHRLQGRRDRPREGPARVVAAYAHACDGPGESVLTGAAGVSGAPASEPNGLLPYGREVTVAGAARIGTPGEERIRDTDPGASPRAAPRLRRILPVRWTLRTAGSGDGRRPDGRHARRTGRPARDGAAHRPGQPVHRHRERGQHLPRRRRALRHGAAVARHRAQHRLRLLPDPHPGLLPRPPLRCRLPASAATCRSCRRPATSRAPTTRPTPPSSATTARSASPGHYEVGLKTGIDAELTRHRRTGVPALHLPGDRPRPTCCSTRASRCTRRSRHRVEILDDRTVRTTITGSGFCRGTKPYTVHTITRFDRPFTAYGTWDGDHGHRGLPAGRRAHGAYVRFDTTNGDRTVEATTALSYVDAEGRPATCAPRAGAPFDEVREAARDAWEDAPRRRGCDRRLGDAAPDLLLVALPQLPRPEHRQRRRRPLHRLGPEDPPRAGLHLLPELVPLGHLPHPGTAPVAARAA